MKLGVILRPGRVVVAAALVVSEFALPVTGGQRPPPKRADETPTYCRDVLPILIGDCSRCHYPQSLLGNWLEYKTAFAHRAAIKRRVWNSWRGRYYKEPMPVANTAECQAMTAEARATIKRWVEAGAPYGVPVPEAEAASKTEQMARGRQVFYNICKFCHQPNAAGIPGKFPPLAASDFLNADKDRAIHTVLTGCTGPIVVNGQTYNNSMPTLPLTDEQVANVLTFVYNSFGNSGKTVSRQEVKVVRSQPAAPTEGRLATRQNYPPPPPEQNPYE